MSTTSSAGTLGEHSTSAASSTAEEPPRSPPPLTADERAEQTKLQVEQATQARELLRTLSETVLKQANDAARRGLRFALFPVVLMCLVGSGIIAAAMFDTVMADPDAVYGGEGRAIMVTGTALSPAEFVATMIVGAILLLASPVVLHFAGELSRNSSVKDAQPALEQAGQLAKTTSDAVAGAVAAFDRVR